MIDSIITFLLKKKTLLSISGIFLFLFGISLFNRFLGSDECWFGEQSYWLLNDGIVRIKSMPDILGLSERCYVYHKLFIFMGSGVITLFGWSVTYFRITTLIFFFVFLWVFVKYIRNNKLQYNNKHLLIAVFLLIVNPMVALKSFEFRPEIMLMSFGFLSFVFLDAYNKLSFKISWAILGGVFSGLAFLTNMNGVAFCVSGFFFLLFNKKYKGLVIYTLSSFSVISLFFFDLLHDGAWETFIFQLTHGVNNLVNENIGEGGIWQFILSKIIRLSKEHERFFWSDKTMFFSALFLLAFISKFKTLKREYHSVWLYLILLIISNNTFGSHVAERYIMSYYPFMALVISVFLVGIINYKRVFVKVLAVVIFVVQIANSFIFISKIINKNNDFVTKHEMIFDKINSKEANILGPWDLIYNGIEDHQLFSFKTYEYLDHIKNEKMTQQQFLERANNYNIDFIVLPESMKDDALKSWFSQWVIEPNPYYSLYYENSDFMILQKKE